jgi:glutamyl-Q tRNA(Asp) synthetase
VRIEDVDMPRARAGAADDILRGLERHGFAWDGPVLRQSTRTQAYEDALAALRAQGLAYACVCTRRDLAALPLGAIGERVYPGTCRTRTGATRERAHSIRVRVPDAPIGFVDRVFGSQVQQLARDVGDFVVRRSDGLFAYQLAVVVDDAAQGITDVVRGADLLTSTPRQIFLQRALALPLPRYLHVPVAVDARGAKLAKSTGSARLPRSPLPALAAAWRFLGQASSAHAFASVAEFWTWAIAHWQPERIAAARTLPAPAPFAEIARV